MESATKQSAQQPAGSTEPGNKAAVAKQQEKRPTMSTTMPTKAENQPNSLTNKDKKRGDSNQPKNEPTGSTQVNKPSTESAKEHMFTPESEAGGQTALNTAELKQKMADLVKPADKPTASSKTEVNPSKPEVKPQEPEMTTSTPTPTTTPTRTPPAQSSPARKILHPHKLTRSGIWAFLARTLRTWKRAG